MPIETIRGCGYRQVGGLYLVSDAFNIVQCDRLPMEIPVCACCGEHPRFTRGIAKIDPYHLWGDHPYQNENKCLCKKDCYVCYPNRKSYLMWIGKEYTMGSFYDEAYRLGISKRIPHIPEGFELGDSVFLAMKNYLKKEGNKKADAVIIAFKPNRVEYLQEQKKEYSKKEQEKINSLKERGITIIYVKRTPDNEVHFQRHKERKPKSKPHIPLDDVWENETEDTVWGQGEILDITEIAEKYKHHKPKKIPKGEEE